MHLVVIGWLYVVLMMAVAEAANTTGTVLGGIVTFFLYGLMPVAWVIYLMRTPQRRRERKAREAAELAAARAQVEQTPGQAQAGSGVTVSADPPNAGGHAPGASESGGIAPMRKEA